MSFAIWSEKPHFAEDALTSGEKIYPVGDKWVVTDGPMPTQIDVDRVLAPTPDVHGFVEALKSAMGGIVASNALAKSYPLFFPALDRGVWVDVQALIIDAKATLVLSLAQYAAFQTLAAKYHLPVTLP